MHNISLSQFKALFSSCPYASIGDDFFIMDIQLENRHKPLSNPCRFGGYMFIYCIKGSVKLNVNLSEYVLNENMLFLNLPGNILQVNEIMDVPQNELRYICMAMSESFVKELRIDVSKIFNDGMMLLENPSVTLRSQDKEILFNYFSLITSVVKSNLQYRNDVIHSILSSMFYLFSGIWSYNREEQDNDIPKATSRGRMVFEKFIKLVKENHVQYRNVSFYADKLCLTPKYLSKLIKDVSGRSAPEWIDSYVVLEAKNMLKYTNVPIKEIVYRLNFPNQSVFYKFFKSHTGTTPSKYRNL